jgi:transcriptional regulatory protein RtcR
LLSADNLIPRDKIRYSVIRKKTVVIGLLGTVLDRGRSTDAARWNSWRPTVDLCRQDDLVVDRLDLVHARRDRTTADVVVSDIRSVSPETTVRQHIVEFRDPWDFGDVYEALYQFAQTYPFDVEHEDYLVHVTTGTHVAQICLFLLTETRLLPARLLQSVPPRRRQATAAGSIDIIDLDLSKYDRLAARFEQQRRDDLSFLKAGIDTRSPLFNSVMARIEQVATASRAPLLLTGPTGAGKSKLARRIYELKKIRQRVTGALIEVNCGTVRGDAAMSTLFGHVRGSFTGALRDRPGLLRAANGGVLFLDEVGELGADEQSALLKAIEEKQFLPLGSDTEVRSEFQLIAGTNADLSERVREGRFREDLLARINLWTFRLPALTERPEDLEPNLEYELSAATAATGGRISMSREARDRFLAFATSPAARWPGNFRDFNGAVLRMATLAPGGRITEDVVREEIARLEQAWVPADSAGEDGVIERLMSREQYSGLDLFDRLQLAAVARVCRTAPSLSEAGRRLFAASRSKKASPNDADRLRKYLARFGLSWSAMTDRP